ncbi:hypothetical protein NLJ89_g11230 [Agrocybe chaxingu]|uniref:MYND-type domain-containing protein n=1 Tax=Agrocybe chaxingu TaxID=84603 RepID=A0A9W8MRC6_9AGAR|nr:hypothetical protein NLJ89_g11230 [Agrocybe chaxingu]
MTSSPNAPPSYLSDPILLEELFHNKTLDDSITSTTQLMHNYGVMWSNCFIPATTAYLMHSCIPYSPDYPLANHFLIAGNCQHRWYTRQKIRLVKVGAARKDVDDMLEYRLQLAVGIDGPMNNNATMRLFSNVHCGPFPTEKRAIAASLITFLLLHGEPLGPKLRDADPTDILRTVQHYRAAAVFCYESCKLGLLSYICVIIGSLTSVAELEEDYGQNTKIMYLNERYEEFKKETGYQPPKSHFCVHCGVTQPFRMLQKCGGPCHHGRKPVYCGRQCQKAHWKTHRECHDAIYCKHLAGVDDDATQTTSN